MPFEVSLTIKALIFHYVIISTRTHCSLYLHWHTIFLDLPSPHQLNASQVNYEVNNNIQSQDKQIYCIYDQPNCETIIRQDQSTKEDINKLEKSLWTLPKGKWFKILWWYYTWPIKFILTLTIPNPKTFKKLYPLTFALCVVWIGANSYLIVWMMTTIGELLFWSYWISIFKNWNIFGLRSYLLRARVCNGSYIFSCRRVYARSYLKCSDDS